MLLDEDIKLVNDNLSRLNKNRDLISGLKLAQSISCLIDKSFAGTNVEDVLDSKVLDVLSTGNTKIATWFVEHPYLGGHVSAFELTPNSDSKIQPKFYHLSNSISRKSIAGAVQLTPNWEDHRDLTRNGDFKIGIDFFLNQNASALLFVVSLEGNLRVIEFSEKLTTTQVGILNKIQNVGNLQEFESVHASLWNALAIREVNREFYQGISEFFEELRTHLIENSRDPEETKLFASRLLGRLLFIWFLRKKGLISQDHDYFEVENTKDQDYYQKYLKKLFFEVLAKPIDSRSNSTDIQTPYLNGGLFEIHHDDWYSEIIEFPKYFFYRLFEHFNQFNFTTDESSPEYEQIAIDPEMLGRVFESLLASQLTETGESARKAKGAFYTPREVVAHMCKETLRQYLYSKIDNPAFNGGIDKLLDATDAEVSKAHSNFIRDLWGRDNLKIVAPKLLIAIDSLRVIDPACGSGAFPLGMVQLLTKVLERLDSRFDPYKTKQKIIRNSIYGVDIEPMAVEIAKLRTWLSLIVEQKDITKIEPLPNLDFKYVCANSLLTLEQEHSGLDFGIDKDLKVKLESIRDEYFETNAIDKKIKLKQKYYQLTKPSFVSEFDLRTKQLTSFDPFQFSSPADFFEPEHMFGVKDFDIVIGNPPYIGEKGNKELFRSLKGSEIFRNYYQGRADLFHYFFHLGIDLLAPKGLLAYITTNYYPTATLGSTLRKDIKARTEIVELINFQEVKIFESALGQHNLITMLRQKSNSMNYECKQTVVTAKGLLSQQELFDILNSKSELAIYGKLNFNQLFDGDLDYIRFFSQSNFSPIFEKMKIGNDTLGQLVEINQGIISGIDKFTKGWKEKFPKIRANVGDPVFIFSDKEAKFPHLRPWIKNSEIVKYLITAEPKSQILWLGRGYPKPTTEELRHLKIYKEILENRREFVNGRRPWFELHWAREESIFVNSKLVVSYRTYDNKFAFHKGELFGGADLTFLTEMQESKVDLKFVLGLLNSDLIYFWFYFKGKRKGEMLELKQVPVSEVPIARDINLEDQIKAEVDLIIERLSSDSSADIFSQEKRINELVFDLYKLEDGEIMEVSNFVNSKLNIRKGEVPSMDEGDF